MSRKKWILAGAAGIMAVCLAAFAWNRQEEAEAAVFESIEVKAGLVPQAAGGSIADSASKAAGGSIADSASKTAGGSIADSASKTAGGRNEDSAEKAVKDALEKLEDAESMSSAFSMDMGIEVFYLKLNAAAAMDMTSFQSPMKIRSDIDLDLGLLGNTQLQVYAVEQNDKYLLYLKDKEGWSSVEKDAEELVCYNGQQLMAAYLKQLTELKEAGTEKLPTGTAYKYTGVVKNDGLQKVLLDTGSLKLLPLLLTQHKLLKPLGTLLQTQQEQLPDMLKKSEDLQVILWIDASTGYPVQCSMDITRLLNGALKLIAASSSESKGSTGKELWSQLEITKAEIMIQCSDFNEAQDFEIPREALKAAAR